MTNLDIIIVAVIAIVLTPLIICIIKAASDRLDLSPAGRIKLTKRYLSECQAYKRRTSKHKKFTIEDFKEYEFKSVNQ